MKQKILFAVLMAMVTTSVVSFTLVSFNRGMSPGFLIFWLKSWLLAYVTALPVIILVSPKVQEFVAYVSRSKAVSTDPIK